MYGCKRWCSFAYNWMHANLNITLFYDLVLLIENAQINWKSTPTLNAKIEEHYICKAYAFNYLIAYRVFVFAEILEPPPSSPLSSPSPTPSILEVRPAKSPCQYESYIWEDNMSFFRKIIKRYFGLTLSLSSLHHIWDRMKNPDCCRGGRFSFFSLC